jgi:hypothetical protein
LSVLVCSCNRHFLCFSDLKINDIVLQIIPREHDFDFRHRTGETGPAKLTCPDSPGPTASCCFVRPIAV